MLNPTGFPPKQSDTVNMQAVYKTLLRIVAAWDETGYTVNDEYQQAVILEHDNLPDPASDESTSKG